MGKANEGMYIIAVSYTNLRAHETRGNLVCRLLLEKNTWSNAHPPPHSRLELGVRKTLGGVTRVPQASNPEPYELSRLVVVVHQRRLGFLCLRNAHALCFAVQTERELAHPKITFSPSFLQQQYPHVRRRRVVCRYSKKQVTRSAEVPVLHTPVEEAKVRFSMTCSFVDGQGKRGNVHNIYHYTGDHVGRFPKFCRVWRFHLVVE